MLWIFWYSLYIWMEKPFQQGIARGQRHGHPAAKASQAPVSTYMDMDITPDTDTERDMNTQTGTLKVTTTWARPYLQPLITICSLFQLACNLVQLKSIPIIAWRHGGVSFKVDWKENFHSCHQEPPFWLSPKTIIILVINNVKWSKADLLQLLPRAKIEV